LQLSLQAGGQSGNFWIHSRMFRMYRVHISSELMSVADVLHGCSHSFQANAGLLPRNRSLQLSFRSLPSHHSWSSSHLIHCYIASVASSWLTSYLVGSGFEPRSGDWLSKTRSCDTALKWAAISSFHMPSVRK